MAWVSICGKVHLIYDSFCFNKKLKKNVSYNQSNMSRVKCSKCRCMMCQENEILLFSFEQHLWQQQQTNECYFICTTNTQHNIKYLVTHHAQQIIMKSLRAFFRVYFFLKKYNKLESTTTLSSTLRFINLIIISESFCLI